MKVSLNRVAWLGLALLGMAAGVEDEATICDQATKQSECPEVSGCRWEGNGQNAHCDGGHEHVNCADRSHNDCEDDDSCFLENIKGTKSCREVNLGHSIDGEWCQSMLLDDEDGAVYVEVPDHGCHEGFICSVGNQTDATPNVPINGTCTPTECLGKKVPGNCNGNAVKDQCEATTQRVTICHRTCSEKNPWVRITVDEDAWSGEGCGHMREHNVTEDCKNKAPWTAWGPNRNDYLIKFHGTREHVASINKFNKAQEKAYWRKWEPACPYVRNGQCCDWDDEENPCCGIRPEEIPDVPPAVEVKKYAGPLGKCSKGNMNSLEDTLYSLPEYNSAWQYCYVVTVPDNSECLYNMAMNDYAPIGGMAGYQVTEPADGTDFNSLHMADTMCAGDVKYIPGPEIPDGIEESETGYDICVEGTGVMSGTEVSACDPAGVQPPPCDMVMGKTDEDLCPGNVDAVSVLSMKTSSGHPFPVGLDPSSLFYDMSIGGAPGIAAEVTFKVDNPMLYPVDMYVQYHKKAENSVSGALDPSCEQKLAEPGCNVDATSITAGCIHPADKPAFALVSVFFLSDETDFDIGGSGVAPYECCEIPDSDLTSKSIIEYEFKVLCECPSDETSRLLATQEDNWLQLWDEHVGTKH